MLPLTNCESQCGQINQTQSCSAANNRSLLFVFFYSSLSLSFSLFPASSFSLAAVSIFPVTLVCSRMHTYTRCLLPSEAYVRPQPKGPAAPLPTSFCSRCVFHRSRSQRAAPNPGDFTHAWIQKDPKILWLPRNSGGMGGGGWMPDAETEKTTIHFNESKT